MQYVEAVAKYGDMPRPWVFLAGGIVDCPDWQAEVVKRLEDLKVGTLLNPRRKNFPIHDPSASYEQIQWERHALWAADIVAFWFSDGPSVQPIVMFEFGHHLARYLLTQLPLLTVGVHPEYKRRTDVLIQLEVAKARKLRPVESIAEHAWGIYQLVKEWTEAKR
jgi:hypothetical protein